MDFPKIALITGATSGIGWATACKLHQLGFRIIATGRRQERLTELQSILKTNILTLQFDVSNRNEVQNSLHNLPEDWSKVDVLINNAGNAHGLDLIQDGKWTDWEAMIDINLKGLLAVTEVVLPGMVERKSGHIINLGSIAGDQAYAKGAVYCASKAAVSLLTQGMRLDLNAVGIKVSELKAGMVETEFSKVRFKGDLDRAAAVYSGLEPLKAEDVADTLAFMISAPKHVNLAEVLLLPLAQASAHTFNRSPQP
ncbi:MAG TPA: SDR family NAD(P)-dependent oxidoreductase [Catalimonadaceae bacterium]|nr:SDR family NAD(P)-dependent oxidoreductase [Catalimonadaceae bacterium]